MSKTRLNISLDRDLAEFAKNFAAENRTSVANIVTQYLLSLKRRVEGKYIEEILGDKCLFNYSPAVSPDFYGWIFPKGDRVSIGIGSAAKSRGELAGYLDRR